MGKDYSEQANFLKEHLPDIITDIKDNEDRLFSEKGIFKTLDYDNIARYAFANYIIKDGEKFWYRIYVNMG
jgi:hypothetical protein